MNIEKTESVLVVDSDKTMLEATSKILSKRYAVTGLTSSKSVIKHLSIEETPKLLIIDSDLPDIDGYILCKQIRHNPLHKNLPIIVLCSQADLIAEEKAFLAGATDFIRKPFSTYALETRVHLQLLYHKRLQREEDANDVKTHTVAQIKEFTGSLAAPSTDKDGQPRFHVIDLNPIKGIFKNRWEKVRNKIIFIADHIISQSINNGESFKYIDNNIFVIVYPMLSHLKGKTRTKSVAEQLCAKILGERFSDDGTDIVSQLIAFDLADSEAENEMSPEQRQHDAMNKKILSEIKNVYGPIWNPMTKNVEGYRAIFFRDYHGKPFYGTDVLLGGPKDHLWPTVYSTLLNEIYENLKSSEGMSPYYVVPIHIDLLTSNELINIIDGFCDIPMIKFKLRIEIIGIHDHLKLSALESSFVILKKFCDTIMVRISPDTLLTHELRFFGVTSIGLNLQELAQCGLGQRGSYVVATHFAKKAHQLGLNCYVWGIDDVADFQLTSAAKFDLFSGIIFAKENASSDNAPSNKVYPFAPLLIVSASLAASQGRNALRIP